MKNKKLLQRINQEIIQKYQQADIPMFFKTKDCAQQEWAGRDMRTGKVRKYKFISRKFGGEYVLIE